MYPASPWGHSDGLQRDVDENISSRSWDLSCVKYVMEHERIHSCDMLGALLRILSVVCLDCV